LPKPFSSVSLSLTEFLLIRPYLRNRSEATAEDLPGDDQFHYLRGSVSYPDAHRVPEALLHRQQLGIALPPEQWQQLANNTDDRFTTIPLGHCYFFAKKLKWHFFEPLSLPPYSPDFNPIVRKWFIMKAEQFANIHCRSTVVLIERADRALCDLMDSPTKVASAAPPIVT
jgi:hypothetical protein